MFPLFGDELSILSSNEENYNEAEFIERYTDTSPRSIVNHHPLVRRAAIQARRASINTGPIVRCPMDSIGSLAATMSKQLLVEMMITQTGLTRFVFLSFICLVVFDLVQNGFSFRLYITLVPCQGPFFRNLYIYTAMMLWYVLSLSHHGKFDDYMNRNATMEHRASETCRMKVAVLEPEAPLCLWLDSLGSTDDDDEDG